LSRQPTCTSSPNGGRHARDPHLHLLQKLRRPPGNSVSSRMVGTPQCPKKELKRELHLITDKEQNRLSRTPKNLKYTFFFLSASSASDYGERAYSAG
jgi:hypothetical protein